MNPQRSFDYRALFDLSRKVALVADAGWTAIDGRFEPQLK